MKKLLLLAALTLAIGATIPAVAKRGNDKKADKKEHLSRAQKAVDKQGYTGQSRAEALEQYLISYPRRARYDDYIIVGDKYAKNKEWKKAQRYYHTALNLCDTSCVVRVSLSEVLIEQGKNQEALTLLNDSQERFPGKHPRLLIVRANLNNKMGDTLQAIDDMLQSAIQNSHITYSDYGTMMKDYPNLVAAAALQKSIFIERDFMRIVAARAYEFAELYIDAARLLELVVKSDRFYIPRLCYAYFMLCLFDDAVKWGDYYQSIPSYSDQKPDLFMTMASAHHYLGNYQKAIELYTKAYRMDPKNNADCIRMKANTYFTIGDTSNSVKCYNAALELNPKDAQSLFYRGVIYNKMGYKEKAHQDFKKMLEITPNDMHAFLAHFYMGNTERAKQICDSLLQVKPYNCNAQYGVACLYSVMDNKPMALAHLRKAIDMGYRNLGHIQWDFDMDNIKNTPEFKALIEEYKNKPLYTPEAKLPGQ